MFKTFDPAEGSCVSMTARCAVFNPEGRFLESREMPVDEPGCGQVVVAISLSAICGSDLHTAGGRRNPGGSLILGHEICGEILSLGEGVERDFRGNPLQVGDRVTWSLTATCGKCFYCRCGLSQKCESLFKYGHSLIRQGPGLSGGFASHIVLRPGTAIFRLPDRLPDSIAVFANCAMATAVSAVRQVGLREGDQVLIQGSGLLGLCCAVAAREAGAARVTIVDRDTQRLDCARRFGVDHACLPEAVPKLERGYDAAIEVCGRPEVIADGMRLLRKGGAYVLCGCVFPGARLDLDVFYLTTHCLKVSGWHNYVPKDLDRALQILEGAQDRYPFSQVVARILPLAEIDEAMRLARDEKSYLRVALDPRA